MGTLSCCKPETALKTKVLTLRNKMMHDERLVETGELRTSSAELEASEAACGVQHRGPSCGPAFSGGLRGCSISVGCCHYGVVIAVNFSPSFSKG